MSAKNKRDLARRETGPILDGASPAKRLRTEDVLSSLIEDGKAAVETPSQIDDVLDEQEHIEAVPAPIVDDLYLETVCICWSYADVEGKPVHARIRL